MNPRGDDRLGCGRLGEPAVRDLAQLGVRHQSAGPGLSRGLRGAPTLGAAPPRRGLPDPALQGLVTLTRGHDPLPGFFAAPPGSVPGDPAQEIDAILSVDPGIIVAEIETLLGLQRGSHTPRFGREQRVYFEYRLSPPSRTPPVIEEWLPKVARYSHRDLKGSCLGQAGLWLGCLPGHGVIKVCGGAFDGVVVAG